MSPMIQPSGAGAAGAGGGGDDRSQTPGIPRCVCGWKNCRVYQKAFREGHHDSWDGVIKIKFVKGEPESMALKDSIDRNLRVDSTKRNDWKKVKGGSDQEVMRYTIARHHFSERHVAKYLQDPKNYSFLKPFTEHGAKKYLHSVDPKEALTGEDGEVLYLQVPNNPKEVVKAHFLRLKERLEKGSKRASADEGNTATTSTANSNSAENSVQAELLHQKEQENVKLKEQLESMQSQLTFLHDMVRKLQEEHFDHQSVRSGPSTHRRSQPQQQQPSTYRGSMRSRHTISSRSGRSGVPHEIELGEEEASNFYGETEFDWSEHLEYGEEDETTVGTFQPQQGNFRRRGSVGSVTSKASRATSIVSASKSVKSLPREIELDEDEDDSDTHESLEEEAFENRSVVSSNWHSQHSRSQHHNDYGDGGGGDEDRNYAMSGTRPATQPNSRKPARRNSRDSSMSSSNSAAAAKRKGSSLAKHFDKNKENASGSSVADNSTMAGTYQVQALVVTDPYGEQGSYTGSISNSTNMPHGSGRLEYDRAGRWYEGDWKHGRWTGQGRLSNGDGDYYEGGLKNDHKHGKGIMKFADGRIFEGEYINGQMIEGKMTYQDGSTYTGTWVDGMRHGKGRCVFTDNSVYEGEFREGEFFGYGKMTWSDGGWYEGNWVYGEMDGLGKEVRPDGSLRHDGQWRKGQPIRK